MKRHYFLPLAAALSLTGLLGAPLTAHAQDAPAPVTIDLKDAPIRSALEQIFNAANVQYQMDNQVQGFVTLKIRDQPFENALKLIMRSATIPLTYTKENGVYIVKPRPVVIPTSGLDTPVVDDPPARRQFEIITLSYIDAMDLDQLFGPFIFLRPFQRQQQGGQMGGGFGGGGGQGGLGGGGFGGGQGGGLGGGGFGGGQGGGLGGGGFGGGQGGGLGGGGGGLGGGGGFGGGGFGGGRGF